MIAFHSTQAKIAAAALVALFAAAPLADMARAQQVGTAAAVNPAAQARGSGGSRTIVIGQSIAHRERVQTTSAGSVQLLFLDKTSMTIGPNSDLAIDEYVYDPASNTGKLAATLTKGVMRFVGGQISHAGNAQVTTPNAVVGIRGGVGIFSPQSVYIGYGEGNVRSGSSNVTLSAGEYTQTLGGGAPPTNPGAPPSGFLQSVLAALQSQQGQGGGARATAGQVNQARTNASGSSTGTIATNVQNVVNQTINNTNQTNALSSINQTIQTTVNQTRVECSNRRRGVGTQYLTAFTGGLVFSRNNYGPFGPIIAALGGGGVQTNAQGQNELAAFGVGRVGDITPGSGNPYNPYAGSSDEFHGWRLSSTAPTARTCTLMIWRSAQASCCRQPVQMERRQRSSTVRRSVSSTVASSSSSPARRFHRRRRRPSVSHSASANTPGGACGPLRPRARGPT